MFSQALKRQRQAGSSEHETSQSYKVRPVYNKIIIIIIEGRKEKRERIPYQDAVAFCSDAKKCVCS